MLSNVVQTDLVRVSIRLNQGIAQAYNQSAKTPIEHQYDIGTVAVTSPLVTTSIQPGNMRTFELCYHL